MGDVYSRIYCWAGKNTYLLLVLLSLLVSAFLRLPYFQYDFIFVDEAHWANGANTLYNGGRLYLDIALDKNPPVFWFCALLFKLFGPSMMAIHTGALLLVWMTSVLLYLLGARFFSKGTGAAAAILHSLAGTTYYIPRIIGMNTEILMVVFSTLAALTYLTALNRERLPGFFAAGIFASCAVFAKPVAATEFAMLLFFLLWDFRKSPGAKIKSISLLIAGFAFGFALFTGIMHYTGILAAWWDQAILYSVRYVGRISSDAFLFKSLRVTSAFVCIFAWLFLLVGISRKTRHENARTYYFTVFWLTAAFAGVVLGRRYYANYFLQIMPPLSLLGGLGLRYLWSHRTQRQLRTALKVCGAAFLVSFVWFHSRTVITWLALPFPQLHTIKLWDMGAEERRIQGIADYIKAACSPDDKIFIWGSKPQLLFLAQRQTVTGWMDYDVADDYPPGAGDLENQARIAALLRRTKPQVIADVQKVASIEKNPIFRPVVEELYVPGPQIHGSRLYLRREIAAAEAVPDRSPQQKTGGTPE